MNLEKRVEILEKCARLEARTKIDDADRFIVIPFENGNETEKERLLQEKLDALTQKYGTVCLDDFTIVYIRKFFVDAPKKSY